MPWRSDPLPSARLWHAIGFTGYLVLLALYAAAGTYTDPAGIDPHLYWLLGGAAVLGMLLAIVGRFRGWQESRPLLQVWPVAALLVSLAVGIVEPSATHAFPGTFTMTFAYIGLTCPRWRSLVLLPLAVLAYVVGVAGVSPAALPKVLTAPAMWILVAEVPAWLLSRLAAQSAMLGELAQRDALTQLFNRTTLGPQLSTHAAESAVVLIDLDDFKGYNDAHGHQAGDELLVDFADALRGAVRRDDAVFRLGGDEFLLLLVGADRAAAEQAVQRLRRQWAHSGRTVGFSAGIASGETDLLRLADEHMYAEKRSRDRQP